MRIKPKDEDTRPSTLSRRFALSRLLLSTCWRHLETADRNARQPLDFDFNPRDRQSITQGWSPKLITCDTHSVTHRGVVEHQYFLFCIGVQTKKRAPFSLKTAERDRVHQFRFVIGFECRAIGFFGLGADESVM